ncbi:MAG: DUF3131 domain-containing protein [Oscillospiraceae bacterium]|nr:DUF3131 domain-containing protein [Oscillospiraceae bacterium]
MLRSARAAYRYFTDFITAENNFLPPDNFQEHIGTPARQTSPTNIGLALLAPIAAVELRLTNQRAATALIGAMLRSVERLPKWRGHLYNWYDVRTARVAQPRFISAVDSGNFAVCLAALESALIEYGEQPLAERAARLYRDMDFTALYDKNRQLFLVGAGGTAVYDRMASETVLTSFIAIARGEAPVRHWRALSRAAVRVGGRRGMASWTGTMFEYLMPMLFLPYYERSLLRAAASVCVYAHKKAAGRSPWGSSESAYFEYDERGGYKYKAHGAASIAVRRGMERDAVIAPYAGQLAVELDPGGATANLRRLEKLGAFGRYGFMDAVDFTRRRVGKTPKLVPIYMAHHIGMGLIATANYLSDGVFRRYFMSRRETEAFCELLEERAPDAP